PWLPCRSRTVRHAPRAPCSTCAAAGRRSRRWTWETGSGRRLAPGRAPRRWAVPRPSGGAPPTEHCRVCRRVAAVAGRHHLVQPLLRRLEVLGRAVPLVQLLDEDVAGLTLPGQHDGHDAVVEAVQLAVQLLEDVLQIAGQFLEGGEGDGYVVVGFDSAGHDPPVVVSAAELVRRVRGRRGCCGVPTEVPRCSASRGGPPH